MEKKKLTMAERLADMPQEPRDLEKFKSCHRDYEELYGTEPDYTSDHYRQFVVAMKLIEVNDRVRALDYNFRSVNNNLSEEEKENIEKWKKFYEED